MLTRRRELRLASLAFLLALPACSDSNGSSPLSATSEAIHKIQHVVVIMQENRSFDSYFGTFPGADGIPMQNGVPAVCVPDPELGACVHPYHNSEDKNFGGPTGSAPPSVTSTAGRWTGSSARPSRAWGPPATREGCQRVQPMGRPT